MKNAPTGEPGSSSPGMPAGTLAGTSSRLSPRPFTQLSTPPSTNVPAWPLTEAQSGLWYAQQLAPANPGFNTGHALWIHGPLDREAFTVAADQAVREAQSLQLAMRESDRGPEQWLDGRRTPWLETIDLSEADDPSAAARAEIQRDLDTPIVPTRDRLALQRLYRLGPEEWVWYQRAHHLATDGYGMALWSTRVSELYAAARSAREEAVRSASAPTLASTSTSTSTKAGRAQAGAGQAPLGPLQAVIDEDAAYRRSERRAADAAWWREAFTPLPEVVGMAAGRAVSSRHALRRTLPLDAGLLARLTAFARRIGQTWPDLLTALTALYCLRMAGTGQTVVGVPYMGRMGSASARTSATMMNVLPLTVSVAPDDPLDDTVRALSDRQRQARRHGRYRSEQLRRDLGLLGGQRRLHGALINVQPFYRPVELPGVQARLEILSTGPVDDITIGYRGDGRQRLDLEIEANPDLYRPEQVAAHLDRLPAFLEAALSARTVGDIPLATPAEAQRYLFDCNATDVPVAETTLSALIEAAMTRHRDAIALEFEGERLDYAALEARTRTLAGELLARGAGPDRIIAVALPRSLELVIALVAILRAGSAYLPLDPAHPPERLARVVALSRPLCVLAGPAQAQRLPADLPCLMPQAWPRPEPAATTSTVPASASAPPASATATSPTATSPTTAASTAATPALAAVRPEQAAYVIYTSGSTGEPKGVLIEHRAIVNRLEWMRRHYGFEPGERILQKTPATFDVSVWEFFLPLITGATLVVAPPEAHRDPAWLARILREQRIGTCHFVPSMLAAFLDEPSTRGLVLRRIFCSGEELPAALRDRLHATLNSELHNLYGPTEAAVDVSYWPASPDDASRPVPIGFPVWNTRLYVLDERQRPLPAGVAGELWLGGVQLARGYLGRDDLTAERFLPDPFRPGERIYRTGDLARWRSDGAVVFLGRSDHQVKIRGLRIELGEIEAAIAALPTVVRAEVLVREDRPGDRRLVAYVQVKARPEIPPKTQPKIQPPTQLDVRPDPDRNDLPDGPSAEGFDAESLRRQLSTSLPDYMVPAAIVEMKTWPVNANGKLDRGALPAPVSARAAGRPASTETERTVARLFVEVLDLDPASPPGADDDFFDLGGDSLAAVTLLLRIQEHWQRSPGLGALFAGPTVAALAAAIDDGTVSFDSGLAPLIRLAAGDAAAAPLFVIHPAGGICWGYRHLARALAKPSRGPSRSVYGLQSPALAPGHPLPESIDALAREYATRLAEVQPHGPVHLLGWSVGGIIAQAMAVVLAENGRDVGLVAMLDAYPADVWRAEPEPTPIQALRALLAVTGHDPEGHPELTTREAVIAFVSQGDTALGHLPPEALESVVRVVTDTNRLIREHHHRRFAGTLLHVRAGLDHAGKPQLRADGWRPYAAGLDTLTLPMMHAQMTGPEASALLAPSLIERLRA